MKLLFLAIILLISQVGRAQQKRFQFYFQNGTSYNYAAYEQVKFFDNYNEEVLLDYTDKYGRIMFGKPAGTYLCKIMYKGKEYMFKTYIDTQTRLRKVYFGKNMRTYIRWGQLSDF